MGLDPLRVVVRTPLPRASRWDLRAHRPLQHAVISVRKILRNSPPVTEHGRNIVHKSTFSMCTAEGLTSSLCLLESLRRALQYVKWSTAGKLSHIETYYDEKSTSIRLPGTLNR